MALEGNPNCLSDVGVGALCARSAVMGAFLNVKINLSSITEQSFKDEYLQKGYEIEKTAIELESNILEIVNQKIMKK